MTRPKSGNRVESEKKVIKRPKQGGVKHVDKQASTKIVTEVGRTISTRGNRECTKSLGSKEIDITIYDSVLSKLDLAPNLYECVYHACRNMDSYNVSYPTILNLSRFDNIAPDVYNKFDREAPYSSIRDRILDTIIHGSEKFLRKRRDFGDLLQLVAENYTVPGFVAIETENYTIVIHTNRLGDIAPPHMPFSACIVYRFAVVDKRTGEFKKVTGTEIVSMNSGDNPIPYLGSFVHYNGLFAKTDPIVRANSILRPHDNSSDER